MASALAGGDDYELLFTVRPRHRGRLRGARRRIGDLPITRIGVVTRSPSWSCATPSGGSGTAAPGSNTSGSSLAQSRQLLLRRPWRSRSRPSRRRAALSRPCSPRSIVVVGAYETRMLDSGYTAWLEMVRSEDETPAPGAHLVFDATAYCKGSTTAAGVNVRRGIAAADPKLLPVGTVVTLATGDPDYNGVYTIMDTGPKVQGRQLDLYLWSCNEALAFGRRRIEVTVLRLGWDPRASSPSLIDRLFRRREVARRARRVTRREARERGHASAAPSGTRRRQRRFRGRRHTARHAGARARQSAWSPTRLGRRLLRTAPPAR